MYLKNGKKSLSPKWLYLIVPTLFFIFTGLNFLVSQFFDTTSLIKAEIAKKGELQYLFENLAIFAIFLIILLLWVKYIHKQPLIALITMRLKVDWERFCFAFWLWGGAIIAITLLDYFLNPEDYIWNFQWVSFSKLLIIVVLFIPLQTAFEEIFFRGYLMQGLGLATNKVWFPLLFTSVTFGLMHIANPEVEKLGYGLLAYYIGTGIFLGITTLMDDGIELALGFHTANNLFTALLVTSDWTVFQVPSILRDISEPRLGFSVWAPLLVCFPLLLYIYTKKYHWKDWRKRLISVEPIAE